MPLAYPTPDHREAGQHHLHRVGDDVAGAAPLEPVDADLRHARPGAFVEADSHINVFRRGPEFFIFRLVDHFVVIGVRPDEGALEAQFLAGELHFLDGEIDRLHRQHRDPEQPVRIGLAVIREPPVVGARDRGSERRVLHRTREQPDAGIQERGVDPVLVHVGNPSMRVETTLAALGIFHGVVHHRALARADAAQSAHALFAAEDFLLDHQPLFAVLIDHQPRCAVAEGGVHVIVPERQRLQDVAVGVDDVVGSAHGVSPFLVSSWT